MVDLRRTVILTILADWKLWFYVVKSLIEDGKSNVWQYIYLFIQVLRPYAALRL